jgi:hypothetical protein
VTTSWKISVILVNLCTLDHDKYKYNRIVFLRLLPLFGARNPQLITTEERTRIERGYLFLPGSSIGVLWNERVRLSPSPSPCYVRRGRGAHALSLYTRLHDWTVHSQNRGGSMRTLWYSLLCAHNLLMDSIKKENYKKIRQTVQDHEMVFTAMANRKLFQNLNMDATFKRKINLSRPY